VQEVTYSEDQQLLEKIKEGNDKGILELYRLYRDSFMHWAQQNYKIDEENAADVFQDTMVALHNNVAKGKLFELNSSLKTYLYAIGKNIIRKKLNKMEVISEQEEEQIADTLTIEIIDNIALNERQQLVSSLLNTVGEPCRTILRLFYFKGFSMDAIARHLEYKNENVAKTQKLRCITTLKKMLRDRYNSEDFFTAS
jgi:RNA polymerase sigma-70 factor (ECF subfamily)